MILCLDIGNSQLHGGVFDEDHELALRFRKNTTNIFSSDEMGVFLRQVLRENNLDPTQIKEVAICSVVPGALHSIQNACLKYFSKRPFILKPGSKTGLKIKYKNPLEVGTDRIANAIAASQIFPEQNNMIIDLGTATTFCLVNSKAEYLGGVIMPGLKISMKSLVSNTAKLPSVEILPCENTLGRSTVSSIQSGLFWGHIGAMKEIISKLSQECFDEQEYNLIGTGGFTRLFTEQKIFDYEDPNLVLKGLFLALNLNRE